LETEVQRLTNLNEEMKNELEIIREKHKEDENFKHRWHVDKVLSQKIHASLEKLYQSDSAYERAGRLVAEYLFTNWESKLRDSIFLSEYVKNIKKS
jgi:hypothetical protein